MTWVYYLYFIKMSAAGFVVKVCRKITNITFTFKKGFDDCLYFVK